MPRDAFWECSDNRSAQGREGLPPKLGKDTDVCRRTRKRATPSLSRSPYWWQQPRQTHLLEIATVPPTGRLRIPYGSKNKVSKRHRRRNLHSRATLLSQPQRPPRSRRSSGAFRRRGPRLSTYTIDG